MAYSARKKLFALFKQSDGVNLHNLSSLVWKEEDKNVIWYIISVMVLDQTHFFNNMLFCVTF